MEEEQKGFEDICFEFQQALIDVFNNEENIPFLLKYYLMKEVWDSVQENKLEVDMKVREKHPPKPERIVIGEEDGVKIEEVDES